MYILISHYFGKELKYLERKTFAAAKSWVCEDVGTAVLHQPDLPYNPRSRVLPEPLVPLKNSTRTVKHTVIAKGPNKDVLLHKAVIFNASMCPMCYLG